MNNQILCTCTTYLSKPNKYNQLVTLLDSFINYNKNHFNLIGKFLIINEYGRKTNTVIDVLRRKYPHFTFINKTIHNNGQARSLNMIINVLKTKGYKYWLHLEESWECKGNFLKKVHNIMENHNIAQLQLSNDWHNVLKNKALHVNSGKYHIELKFTDKYKEYMKLTYNKTDHTGCLWPLFSLRPGIDRVENILRSGLFCEDYKKRVVTFEYEFALNWIYNNDIIKAILVDPIFYRQPNHVSTYTM